MLKEVLTIGVYGFEAATFSAALEKARADLLVDVRARRGVRGAQYSFANAARLQTLLAEAGIGYFHLPSLAPLDRTRQQQYQSDKRKGVGMRERQELSPEFVREYRASRLRGFDAEELARSVFGPARRPVLLCVEREPAACHRSLLAAEMSDQLGVPVRHLTP